MVSIQGLKPGSSANDLSVGRDKKLICFHNCLCQLRCKYQCCWTPMYNCLSDLCVANCHEIVSLDYFKPMPAGTY